ASPSELEDATHNRGKARHGAAAQIVAIRKPNREHKAIEMARKIALMPEELNFLTQVPFQSIKDVLVIAATPKNDYAPTHGLALRVKPIIFNDRIRQQLVAHLADAGLGCFMGTRCNIEFEIFSRSDILHLSITQGMQGPFNGLPLGI